MELVDRAAEVAAVTARRTTELVTVLRQPGVPFEPPSRLPEWSRLTIVCHLRYGTAALLRMTEDTLAGRETAFYPEGRTRQRPGTLVPRPGEQPPDVLDDWARTAARLDDLWATIAADAWGSSLREPADNPDLGPLPLAGLALARLTEVDVHGVDLDVGFPDWSSALVDTALPARLARLSTRRPSRHERDGPLRGAWLLVADDLRWIVSVDGERVTSHRADADGPPARATITGSRRDLLALLLGRPRAQPLRIDGDLPFGAAFERVCPGP